MSCVWVSSVCEFCVSKMCVCVNELVYCVRV